jgi:SPP1 family predicted phage head-tail adaptor
MKSGRLRESITIEKKVTARGALGEQIVSWTKRAQVFAQIVAEMGGESPKRNFEGEYEQPVTFLIRYRTDISSADRIVHGSKTYSIDGMKVLSLTRYNDAMEIKGVHRVRA